MAYTSVYALGDQILYRGTENKKRRSGKFKFPPSLFCSSKTPTKFKTINGKYVEKLDFLSVKEARDFIAKYKDVDNFEVFGNQSFEYGYISNEFPGEIDWDFEDIVIANIDIEVASEHGFPTVETATEALQAITVRKAGRVYAFGCHPYSAPIDVVYTQCTDEYDMIEQFLSFWESDYPDVVTGWYIKLFDIPYLVNRITRLVGENAVKRLSPWNHIRKREITVMKRTHVAYSFFGIATLDYLELYKKFAPDGKSRENYKLDYICHVELKEQKLSYEEYGSLHLLYKQNFQKFMDYNVHDTYLVEKLDKKLNLLRLAFKLAYHAKCNFDDVFMQTRMWDCLVFNHLSQENIILPAKQSFEKDEYVGAWVKEPIPGKYKWVISFDFTSLYPKLMMQYNLSNDTIINREKVKGELAEFLQQEITIETLLNRKVNTDILKKYNLGVTPNKQLYSNEKEGFLPKILRKMFDDRVRYKKEMKRCQKELEKTTDINLREKLENNIAMYDCFQQSIKVCINSCYGALGNQYFRLFDVRIAEAVTTSGQLAIHWVINDINHFLNKLLGTNNKDYVIAADTDSMYITLESLIDKVYGDKKPETAKIADFINTVCETKLSPFIDQSCKNLSLYTNTFSQELEMKREKICDVAVIVAKKRYIWNVLDNEGVRYSKPKVSIVGLETKRSNVPEWAKNKISEAIGYIISDDEPSIHNLIATAEKEFLNLPVEDLAAPTGMNGLDDHSDPKTLFKKGTPAHVKGSLIYNEFLRRKGLDKKYPTIKEGEKVKWIYLKSPNPIHYDVIAFSNMLPPELNLSKYVDRRIMFNKVLVDPIKAILDVIGWTTETQRGLW